MVPMAVEMVIMIMVETMVIEMITVPVEVVKIAEVVKVVEGEISV
jgi:hypothetical protein